MHETVCNIRVTFGLCSNCSFNVWIHVFASVKIEFSPFYIEFNIIFNVQMLPNGFFFGFYGRQIYLANTVLKHMKVINIF